MAKVDSAAVQDGFDLYLHGFIVTDDGKWTVVQQGMNGARKQARRYHWLSEGLKSFVDNPHAAIEGMGQGSAGDSRQGSMKRRTVRIVACPARNRIGPYRHAVPRWQRKDGGLGLVQSPRRCRQEIKGHYRRRHAKNDGGADRTSECLRAEGATGHRRTMGRTGVRRPARTILSRVGVGEEQSKELGQTAVRRVQEVGRTPHQGMAEASRRGSFAKRVDIGGGRMMYIECHGSGSPTVLLISGTDTASDLWHAADQKGPTVYDDIQKTTRVCAYDRPGAPHLDQTFSRSDPVPQPTSPQNEGLAAKGSDSRQFARLLPTRRERPRSCCAAQCENEFCRRMWIARPSNTMRILSSAEKCRRVARTKVQLSAASECSLIGTPHGPRRLACSRRWWIFAA